MTTWAISIAVFVFICLLLWLADRYQEYTVIVLALLVVVLWVFVIHEVFFP